MTGWHRRCSDLAGAALVVSIVAFMPGSADAHWRGAYWRGGWGWGPAFGLGLGLGYGWGWGYPYAYYPGPITTRRPIPRDRRAVGGAYAFGATGTGHIAGRGAAGKRKPAARRAFRVSFKEPRYFHSRTSTKCPAIAAAAAIAGDTRCVRPL